MTLLLAVLLSQKLQSETCYITPPAAPYVACGWNCNVKAAYLLWSARSSPLSYGTLNRVDPQTLSLLNVGKVLEPDWKYRSGFRVGAGFSSCCDGWDLSLAYTWFKEPGAKRRESAAPGEAITLFFSEIDGKWDFDFQTLDLELGRNFLISQCLFLRPHIGLKGAWLENENSLRSTSEVFESEELFVEKMDNRGVGLRAGLEETWELICGVSLIGEIAVSLLWEELKNDTFFELEQVGQETILDPKKFTVCRIKPVVEASVGAGWETCFCCERYRFSLAATWEAQWWRDPYLTILGEQLSIFLQGLTLEARFNF